MAEVETSVAAVTTKVAETVPAENGTVTNGTAHENGVNGDAEPEVPKEEAAAKKDGGPPVKKARKSVTKDKSSAEKRRSSSRLQNVASGTQLPKEISSENLPKGAR